MTQTADLGDKVRSEVAYYVSEGDPVDVAIENVADMLGLHHVEALDLYYGRRS